MKIAAEPSRPGGVHGNLAAQPSGLEGVNGCRAALMSRPVGVNGGRSAICQPTTASTAGVRPFVGRQPRPRLPFGHLSADNRVHGRRSAICRPTIASTAAVRPFVGRQSRPRPPFGHRSLSTCHVETQAPVSRILRIRLITPHEAQQHTRAPPTPGSVIGADRGILAGG